MALDDLLSRIMGSISGETLCLNPTDFPELKDMLNTLPNTTLTIELSQDPSISDNLLSIEGTFSDTWPLFGLTDCSFIFNATPISLTIAPLAESQDIFSVTVQTQNTFSDIPVNVYFPKNQPEDGQIFTDHHWGFSLAETPTNEYAISDILSLADGMDVIDTIPDTDGLLDFLLLDQLEGSFAPNQMQNTTVLINALVADTADSQTWSIGFLSISNIGFEFYKNYEPLGDPTTSTASSSSWGGAIYGDITIEPDTFKIVLALVPDEDLIFAILPDPDNGFPDLVDLAQLFGGEDLANELETLGINFDIQEIGILFRLSDKSLNAFIKAKIDFFNLPLEISTSFPQLYLYGGLDPDMEQDIYAADVLNSNSDLPASTDVPDMWIQELSFKFDTINNTYDLAFEIDDDWYIGLPGNESFALEKIMLDIGYNNGLTCFFSGTFNIAGIEFRVSASHPGNQAGWTFEGKTSEGQELPIGELLDELADLFGIEEDCIPAPISSLIIENLGVEFNTGTKAFTFTAEAKFLLTDDPDAEPVDIVVFLHLSKRNLNGTEVYEIEFTGKIQIGTLIFSISFDKDDNMTTLMGSYTHTEDQEKINLKNDIVAPISTDLASLVPDGLEIDLRDVVLIYCEPLTTTSLSPIAGQPAKSVFLIGFDLGIDLDITKNIPLVGESLSDAETVGIQNLQVIIASGAIAKNVIIDLNTMLQKIGVKPLPAQGDLTGYVNLSAVLNLGTTPKPLSLPIGAPVPSSEIYPPMTNLDGTSVMPSGSCGYNDGVTWITLQQILGPVNFQRIGIGYKDNVLSFYLSAAITVSGLTLSMDGLSFGSRLDKLTPEISIRGIGIDYANGPVEIGGSLLYSSTPNGDEYDGMATIDVEPLMLSAVGSYIVSDDMDSMFIYAVLGVPLGGVPFFFVTGLAAGFGYNRNLIMPSIYEVNKFPLVSTAMDAAAGKTTNNLTQELALMDDYITPALGDYFGAAGIKFTSFKLLDSFVMLALVFGDRFEIDILGMSSLIVPPESEKTPLAQIQMNLEARIAPEDGFFGVEAVLTQGSYILSRNCHLTGGFAFYLWFSGEHAGDFVVTMGGYNPEYKVPAHYPQVPSLGFNWQVDKCLSLKGNAYFALTPCAFMAGGHLQALWKSGPISAWFTAGADFIISWKPYYYDTRFYIDVGASYTFKSLGSQTITVDVGADIHLWGPDFSGKATVDIFVISFTIAFGDSNGPSPKPLNWNDFRDTFIPDDDKVCSVSVGRGLICKNSDELTDLGVINAKEFLLNTNSLVPIKNVVFGDTSSAADQQQFGIAPMALSIDDLATTHQVTIIRNNQGVWENRESDFVTEFIKKDVPIAMWGTSITPNINGNQFVADSVTGLRIIPAKQPECGDTKEISSTSLTYEDYDSIIPATSFWGQSIPFETTSETTEAIDNQSVDLSGRDNIMSAVGKTDPLDDSL